MGRNASLRGFVEDMREANRKIDGRWHDSNWERVRHYDTARTQTRSIRLVTQAAGWWRCKQQQAQKKRVVASIMVQTDKATSSSIAVQTRRPKTKSQLQQTDMSQGEVGIAMREINPKVDTTSKAQKKRELQLEMMGKEGSMAETEDEKMKACILQQLPEALKKMPDKTSMLLLSIVRKDLEVRSKEPKIPWECTAE